VKKFKGPKYSLQREAPLSPSYIAYRKGEVTFIKKNGRTIAIKSEGRSRRRKDLSNKTAPAKSNLTYTGQMLNAIKGKRVGRGKLEIYISPRRRGGGLNNSQIASIHENVKGNRKFFNLTNLQYKRLQNRVTALAREEINAKLTKI
jgi:hypothetical protein